MNLKAPEKWSWVRARAKKNSCWILLISFMLISFMLKFAILNSHVAPPGSDPGNYLFIVLAFQGDDVAGFGLRYPPIFYLMFGFALNFFNEFMALKVTAGIVSTIIGIPFFVLANKMSDEFIALLCTMFFVFSFEFFGLPAWGGYGNLLGIFFFLWFLFFLLNELESPSTKNLFLVATFFSLILGTHLIVSLFAVITLIVFVLLVIILNIRGIRTRINLFRTFFACGVLSLVLSLPFVPFYHLMLQDYPFSTPSSTPSLTTLFGALPSFGVALFFIVVITLLYLYKREKENRKTHLLILALFLSPLLLSSITSGLFSKVIGRTPIFWNIPITLLMAILLKMVRKWQL